MGTLKNAAEIQIPGPPDKEGSPTTKSYTLSGIGPQVRTLFARVLKARAWAELDSQRDMVEATRFRRMESDVALAMSAGDYDYGGLIHGKIEETRVGVTVMAIARLRVYHPDANEQTVTDIVNAVGWDRLIDVMISADGPPPKEKAPDLSEGTGQKPTTPES